MIGSRTRFPVLNPLAIQAERDAVLRSKLRKNLRMARFCDPLKNALSDCFYIICATPNVSIRLHNA